MIDEILIFTTRHLCYNSGDFFATQLANGFEENGIECEYCQLEFEDECGGNASTGIMESSSGILTEESQRKLESYLGKSYLAVIDFNSRMPHMILDDGSFYLDGIDAPFYDYILDHPLYHHSTLSCQLKNFNVILLDQNQCQYVQQHYPWIKNVIWQPLAGQKAISSIQLEDKKLEVLFTGTYRNPEEVYKQILQEKNEMMRDCMLGMIAWLKQNPNGTVEESFKEVLGKSEDLIGTQLASSNDKYAYFPTLLNACYPVEIYIRNLYRKNLIDTFAKEQVPLRIVGDWWEQYEYVNNSTAITFQPAVSFARSFELINQSAILLDSSPFFQHGIHDRVAAAMANKTIVLTDENAFIKEINIDNCIQTYSAQRPDAAVMRAEKLLTSPVLRKELVEQAYELYEKEFTWKRVAEKICSNGLYL